MKKKFWKTIITTFFMSSNYVVTADLVYYLKECWWKGSGWKLVSVDWSLYILQLPPSWNVMFNKSAVLFLPSDNLFLFFFFFQKLNILSVLLFWGCLHGDDNRRVVTSVTPRFPEAKRRPFRLSRRRHPIHLVSAKVTRIFGFGLYLDLSTSKINGIFTQFSRPLC